MSRELRFKKESTAVGASSKPEKPNRRRFIAKCAAAAGGLLASACVPANSSWTAFRGSVRQNTQRPAASPSEIREIEQFRAIIKDKPGYKQAVSLFLDGSEGSMNFLPILRELFEAAQKNPNIDECMKYATTSERLRILYDLAKRPNLTSQMLGDYIESMMRSDFWPVFTPTEPTSWKYF
ncbi:twin-arginine translocation signal domain-containing protein [Candidatus Micrarchaeota archaeon]|nr:twin-arginine translocation signal domain-containing protein [Candidatus Micrarchaeota archaeon]